MTATGPKCSPAGRIQGFGTTIFAEMTELALKHKASGLILVHNHPSGNPTPSVSDKELTQTVVKASRALNLTVHDHLIISRHGYFSLAEHDML